MNEKFCFLKLGELSSITNLISVVSEYDNAKWVEFSDRKKTGGIASSNTDTIPLLYDHRAIRPTFYKDYDYLAESIDTVTSIAQKQLSCGELKQAILTRLHAGALIGKHKDKGPITATSHRVHVPIITNPHCIFTVDTEFMNMRPGEIWAIDNVGKYHSVSNLGLSHRIHLILDFANRVT